MTEQYIQLCRKEGGYIEGAQNQPSLNQKLNKESYMSNNEPFVIYQIAEALEIA